MHAARIQYPCATAPLHTVALPDGKTWTELYRTTAGFLLRFPGLADFEISAFGTSVTCAPALGVLAATTDHLYFNQVLPFALSQQGKLVFHASAVEITGGSIAFVGDAGRGKSTLAGSFATAGQRFMTDDALILEPCDAGYMVMPSHPSIRLWQDSHQQLMPTNVELAPPVQFTSKARILAGDNVNFCDEPRRLLAAYFLGELDVSDIVIKPLSPSEKLIAWARHAFLLDIEDTRSVGRHFGDTANLANAVPCYEVIYPRRYDMLAKVRAALTECALSDRCP